MLFLTNPKRKTKMARRTKRHARKRRPVPAGFKTWREYMASIRPNPGGKVARRRRRHRRNFYGNPRRHHRRRYRRNPPFGNILGSVKRNVPGSLWMLVGRVGSRAIPDLTGINTMLATSAVSSIPATAVYSLFQLAAGIGISLVAPHAHRDDILKGALEGIEEDLLCAVNPPVIAKYLGQAQSSPVVDAGMLAMNMGRYSPAGAGRLQAYTPAQRKVSVQSSGMAGGRLPAYVQAHY